MGQMQEVLVRHYTEILLLPFRLQHGAFASQPPPSLQKTCERLDQDTTWRAVVDTSIEPTLLNEADTAAWRARQHWAAVSYFHPAVRAFLFGSETMAASDVEKESKWRNDYFRVYRHQTLQRVEVTTTGHPSFSMKFKVERCDLALFTEGVGVLQLELTAYLQEGGVPLGEIQQVRDQLRRAYPPYFEDWDKAERKVNPQKLYGGHFPASVSFVFSDKNGAHTCTGPDVDEPYVSAGFANQSSRFIPKDVERWPMAQHWFDLFSATFTREEIIPPTDDRLPSMAFIAVDDIHRIDEGNWQRLAFADASGSDPLPYSRAFMEKQRESYAYDRFWHPRKTPHAPNLDSTDSASRILNCGYAFTIVGNNYDSGFFLNAKNGSIVAFRQIYARMGLVAHFQKMALLGVMARLAYLAERNPDGARKPISSEKVDALYAEFLEFTQVYWFDEVSPQEQGVELFAMWQDKLRTRLLYAEVRQELQDLVGYANTRAATKLNQSVASYTPLAIGLSTTAAVAALGAINPEKLLWPWVLDQGTWFFFFVAIVVGVSASWYLRRKLKTNEK